MKRFILLLLCLVFSFSLCSCGISDQLQEARQEGYDSGYKDGYAAGAEDGYSDGYADGLRDGVDKGAEAAYSEGYKDGRNDKQASLAGLFTSASTSTSSTASEPNYILNTNTKKFHYPDCSSVDDMKESNKIYFTGTRDEAVSQGYVPCKRCNP